MRNGLPIPNRSDAGVRRVVRLAVALMVAAALASAMLAASSAQAKGGSKLFGLNYSFSELTGNDAQKLSQSGAKTLRWMFVWRRIQPKPGPPGNGWAAPDKLVGDLAAKGIRVIPVLWGSPNWVANSAVTAPIGTPAARNAWRQFLTMLVNRYGPNGSYWAGPYKASHPGKPPLPIGTWQIWNEPNLQSAMNPPSPSNYAKLLELSASAIRTADPSAKLMFAGMPGYSGNVNAWDFLGRVYQTKGARKAFDIAALHPYARTVPQMLGEVKRLRATMRKHGDRRKPLWITEIGWGSLPRDATPFGLTKGKKGQARILKHAFTALKKKRRSWHIKRVLWFNYRDPSGGSVKTCSFCSSAGLLQHDATPKPAWNAFRSFTH
jgi:polysaccharide biosynthesis protein PslG